MTREEKRIKGLELSIEMWEYMLRYKWSSKLKAVKKISIIHNIPMSELRTSYFCPLCYYVGKNNCGSCIDWTDNGYTKPPCAGKGSVYKLWEDNKTMENTQKMLDFLKEELCYAKSEHIV